MYRENDIREVIRHVNGIGLIGEFRKQWIIDALASRWSMFKDEVAEMSEVISAVNQPPKYEPDPCLEWMGKMVFYHPSVEENPIPRKTKGILGEGFYFFSCPNTADIRRKSMASDHDLNAKDLWAKLQQEEEKVIWTKTRAGSVPIYTEHHKKLLKEWQKAIRLAEDIHGYILPCYLQIKKPFDQEYESFLDSNLAKGIRKEGYDGIILSNGLGKPTEFVVFSESQIKSIFENV